MRNVEIETKFALPDAEPLHNALRELGAVPGPATRQIDTYYNPPHRSFLADPANVSEWLRVRAEYGPDDEIVRASVNFKLWHPVDQALKTHADEYETTVGDPQIVHQILTSLDLTRLVVVDKTRITWVLPAVEVVFDHVINGDGQGTDYVEFEYKGDATTVDEATAELQEFISSLDVKLGEAINCGYPHLMLDLPR